MNWELIDCERSQISNLKQMNKCLITLGKLSCIYQTIPSVFFET